MNKIYWYARGGLVKWMGPYKSQLKAWEALNGLDGLPVEDCVVWCTKEKLHTVAHERIQK